MMKDNNEKMPNCFRWLRAVRAQINRETKGMTDEEYCAYIHSSVEEYRKKRCPSASEAGKAAPSRKVEATPRTTASRRKVAKRLAHA